jgi:hypothetical protein
MMPFDVRNLSDVTFQIDGTVYASNNWKHWPVAVGEERLEKKDGLNKEDHKRYQHFWQIWDSNNLRVEGKGLIDGQGYMWWIREILQLNIHQRPNLIIVNYVTGFEWSGVTLKNSPRFHMQPHVVNSYFHDFEIIVDIVGQFHITQLFWDPSKSLAGLEKLLDLPTNLGGIPLPTFPLNTDGIDF